MGVEGDLHFLNYVDYQVHVDASSGFVPALPVPGSFDFNTYDNTPYQLAAYIQDKIELSYSWSTSACGSIISSPMDKR